MNRRQRLAAWFLALPKGRKFVASLVVAASAAFALMVVTNVMADLLMGPPENTVEITCGDRRIVINRDDPIYDPSNLQASAVAHVR